MVTAPLNLPWLDLFVCCFELARGASGNQNGCRFILKERSHNVTENKALHFLE
jgi:hypothetical protein